MESGLGKLARAAFTLIEIVMAVAIIALLTASIVPGLLRPRRRTRPVHVLIFLKVVLTELAIEVVASTPATYHAPCLM
jgi:prepilin-type N-terminal cleavage/methylation domain-containing protein